VKLFSWLSRLRGAGAPPAEYTIRYVSRDGLARPTAEGAWRRVEQETLSPTMVETRYYRLRPAETAPELARVVRQGTDEAGQPYLLRTTYWPWGQESVRLEKCVRAGQSCVEYHRYFGNGDLQVRKRVQGRQLLEDYTFREPMGEYTYVESMPVYPGGREQLLKEVGRLVQYPASALRNRETGKVFIHFVVSRRGRVIDVRLQKGVTPALDAAALQVMREIRQQWKPGFQNRRAVSVSYTIPITFAIN